MTKIKKAVTQMKKENSKDGRQPRKSAAAREKAEKAGPRPESRFPIVGIGASAGGLAAFEAFFSGMPADADPGMAFVLVQHLAPDHKSLLSELIRRYTRMQVFEVEDGMEVKPNCAYIIPPNRDMALLNGVLQLLEPAAPRGHRLPVDFFFRSLAHDQRERAICIVFSGTGSDGTLGVRAIKDEGGIVVVQTPKSAEYDGMPQSAISTGLVDYELQPAEMPAQLIAYVSHAFGKPPLLSTAPESKADTALKKIYVLLRSQTGHDFSQYKSSTIHRRIERRMAVNQIETIGAYLKCLQQRPEEVESLFRDLLIGVTNFFRDPEAFKALEEQIIPALFVGKPPGCVIRVWSPGCSSGEEAYSIAILMQERLEAMKQSYKVQVFATDIDSRAIATARTGLYPASIAADISEERLARFFALEADGSVYRIHKGIRDMLIFSEQDVVKDPPFSKIDLISCRNLMIYMSADLQKRLIPMFHYALNPNAYLFLGTSETVGELGGLFTVLNRKLKLYQRREDVHSVQRMALNRFLPMHPTIDTSLPRFAEKPAASRNLPLRELTEQALLRQVAPAAALVNSHGDILYLHGRTGLYLEPAPGEAGINNIMAMAREGLRHDLTTALHKVVSGQKIVRRQGLRVKTNGDFTPINLTVCPVETASAAQPAPPLYLVILEEAAPGSHEPAQHVAGRCGSDTADLAASITALEQALSAKEEYLQASNEELKSYNEEMQSMNEELQSTNEELETSKEELQSINEELATVNAELQTKVTDLSRVNNDMNNLLAGTGIATLFVDHQLCILNFTPAASQIINLILSDVGRPVGHIVSNLVDYDRLVVDVQMVLDTLVPKEVEVQTTAGNWYTMRILPYRTLDNVIEGAVITFVNITDRKRIEGELQKTQAILQAAMDQSTAGIAIADAPSGVLRYVNDAGLLIRGGDRLSIVNGVGIDDYVTKWQLMDMDGRQLKSEEVPLARAIMFGEKCGRDLIIRRPNNDDRIVMANAAPIKDAEGKVVAGVVVFVDITELRQAESTKAWLSAIVESSHDAIISRGFDGTIRSWNAGAEKMFGYSAGEMIGKKINMLFPAEQPDGFDEFDLLCRGAGAGHSEPCCRTKSGRHIAVQLTQSPILGQGGEPVAVSVIMSDISALKEMQHQMIEVNADLGKKVSERTLYLQQSMGRLRRMAQELTQTEQRERQRLATVLHNDLQQILVAAGLRMERLANTENNADKLHAFQQVAALLAKAVAATRSLATDLRPPVLNSGNLVKSLQWLADWLWKRFDFTLKFSVAEDFHTEALPDEDIVFLFDTARELCFNIVKHAHVKEGRMALERMTEDRLRLSIEDDGVGIDLVRKELPDSADGGLGLRAIQDRLALIGGEIQVDSTAGQGFRVEIILPYAMATAARHQHQPKGQGKAGMGAGSGPKGRKIRVMLVDDHTVVRDGLKMILLDEADIDVIGEAADGEKAVKLVDKLQPDVVIMDVNMPKMNGIEATKLIKQAHPEICVIALSINDDTGTNNAMLEAGACAYLNKSGSADDVCEVIRACQREKPAQITPQEGGLGGG